MTGTKTDRPNTVRASKMEPEKERKKMMGETSIMYVLQTNRIR